MVGAGGEGGNRPQMSVAAVGAVRQEVGRRKEEQEEEGRRRVESTEKNQGSRQEGRVDGTVCASYESPGPNVSRQSERLCALVGPVLSSSSSSSVPLSLSLSPPLPLAQKRAQ